MIRAAILAVLLPAAPACAERMSIHHDAPAGAAWFARVEIVNRVGMYNATVSLDSAHGPVTLTYHTTPASKRNDPESADRVCVVELPDGVIALPGRNALPAPVGCVDVLEDETGEMLLLLFLGG